MSYQIDSNQPSELFLRARNVAGVSLQEMFKRHGGLTDSSRDYKWIKAELTWPSFDHLTFGYQNQVFSVLVELVSNGRSQLSSQEIKRCVDVCTKNNLIPCSFRVDAHTLKPIEAGWNLRHLENRSIIIPQDLVDDVKVEMSEWEIRNFCIQIARGYIEKDLRAEVLSFCDVIGIDPQIWFQDKQGQRSWIIVRNYAQLSGNEKDEWIGFEKSNPQLASYDGYLAAISVASSEPVVFDLDAKIIPLSKRFDGSTPVYRGDGFHVNFKGLQRIFVA